ncbi:Multidrug resistance efflux pump-like protein [Alicyclobacillus hesperidum URH17-3-68]|uniref:Barrel-sandwich domain of CusB or HlyD membrane-fusion n=1 Tax=Alicyclobacillus hesperidum TaxID=89784 RepID=A0A1H2R2Q6_9BACL|nr:HlyD family efflux transporter periplasmic adaptor subunit [Alicyclobacillus hesperidum]KRW92678.1 multidrug transporter [Alicyclobacillus tengchongensis]EJY55440.1 Multidrug resistance efflux pump-like protein [Alicyclobacillus hesperidum URH17-3-68]SDW12979.1 Barrel-sandwich domain of CusB or HlyD membrane-fusion [Alicyclobacillus hesperidum]GLG00438.1 multidrug resistance protein A [Alicyclobacillus hesperidum subsp. aegles]GLV13228.1 multidrug resistance protein A [Alicyclobacillus hesp
MSAKRLLFIQVIIIVVVVAAGFVGYYFYHQSTQYLRTDDAQVTGQQIVIAAPASGQLSSWNGTEGTQFASGDVIGTISVPSGTRTATVNITAPQTSTIVQNSAVNREFVAAGTPLAYAYNLNNLWVTANIKETQINDVHVGQAVDVYVDAYPGTSFSGVVQQIGLATASTFSLLPQTNTNANFTKVTQVIPVTIRLQTYTGQLAPGMSATVRIHK